ncbi:glycoside hydrolase family 38 protein [Tortispora caseinolytica NRRL Y-17796]|uniref:Alpha-mannosidase n=1 Tax=Tortispora caseinolytica NRRL Y-17796 TaxID=767744 RepID=A0A1E4TDL9_9ASCO|nr:glycoside hydrolase family 38 protein [Tortispora caseinolytica NRRL Y-17796]
MYPQLNLEPKAKKVRPIYQGRLNNFIANGQYKAMNLPALQDVQRVSDDSTVKISVFSVPGLKRPLFKDVMADKATKFRPAVIGESFGPSWSTYWFKIDLKIPKSWKDAPRVELHFDPSDEGLIFFEDGTAAQGITGGGERIRWIVPQSFIDAKWHTIYIETSCNGMFGNAPGADNIQPPDPERYFTLKSADLVWPDLEARALYYDFTIIAEAARDLPQDSWQSYKALDIGNRIMNTFDVEDRSTIAKCRKIAAEFLGTDVDSEAVYSTKGDIDVEAMGHCHIDTAWLWPYAETRRKIARSWSNQLELFERYPELHFACSQAQQFQWLLEDYPDLFKRVKDAVLNGNFDYVGGSWVEHDTNLPGGESLVRQFLYGQRFFEGHFGSRSKTFWLPDTFGYSPQIPQLCRLAGMTGFMTQKLSWNNINNFPNSTFNWVALDGSQVICHMCPADKYDSVININDVKNSVTHHKNLDADHVGLLAFGLGDGGGGPTDDMLEKLRRCRGLADNVGGLPRVRVGKGPEDFFADLIERTKGGKDLVTWMGELYFEFHRGVYTTHAKMKLNNRQCEQLFHDLEFFATLASLYVKDYDYPKEKLNHIWKLVLLNQFHDMLPGSAIEMAYDEAYDMYKEAKLTGSDLLRKALIALGLMNDTDLGNLVAVNTLPWPRNFIGTVPTEVSAEKDGKPDVVCLSSEENVALLQPVPAEVSANMVPVTVEEIGPNKFKLANGVLEAVIDGGAITSLFDIPNNREVVAPGQKANQFVMFDDQPLYWQAWDTEVFSLDSRKELPPGKGQIILQSPLRCSVLIEQKISERSWINTAITLNAYIKPKDSSTAFDGTHLEFTSEVYWDENCKFLKVEFPVDVHAESASYEMQYGIVKRPTHYNTSWDVAKFEVCCHKFADLSEHNYGVSILNDCKYGFSTHGNVMRLSLLRAPKAPDAHADIGTHEFSYSIYPHAGPLGANTIKLAHEFNSPVVFARVESTKSIDAVLDTFVVEGTDGLCLSNIKRGEDDSDVPADYGLKSSKGKSVVLRVYDALGGRQSGKVLSKLEIAQAFKSNLLEDDEEELKVVKIGDKWGFDISVRAFEIATYKLKLA